MAQTRFPSVKTLMNIPRVDKEKALELRKILKANKSSLLLLLEEKYPLTYKWRLSCFNEPWLSEVRAEALNECLGTYGVEYMPHPKDTCTEFFGATYLNAGDPYATTLVRWRGIWRVGCWGDIAERFPSQ